MEQNIILNSPLGPEVLKLANGGDKSLYGEERLGSWASFILANTRNYSGIDNRVYPALELPGSFYFKESGFDKIVKPHIELSKIIKNFSARAFVQVFSNMGNALLTPSWLINETKAVRKEINSSKIPNTDILVELIRERRKSLLKFYMDNSVNVKANFNTLNSILYDNPQNASNVFCGDATPQELAKFIPSAPALSLNVKFSDSMKEKFPTNTVFRLGVWRVSFRFEGEPFQYPVVTPRLTKNSLFIDPLYDISNEPDPALLIRCLILDRALKVLDISTDSEVTKDFSKNESFYLRSIPCRENQKKPTPSDSALTSFLNNSETAEQAWTEIQNFISGKFQIAVSFGEFEDAYKATKIEIARLGDIKESWKDILLPLLWSKDGISRLTYVKPNK